MSFLAYLEASAFSQWVLLSMLGFPTLIALHSVGMGVAVGLSMMVALRLNRVLIDFRAELLPKFLSIAVWGFVLNLVTGIALFVSRGQDYITSLIFLLKILLVIVGALILFWLRRRFSRTTLTTDGLVADDLARGLSLLCAVTWVGAVVSGRLIAYLSDLY
ncbi:MAG: hypothetical protein HKN84_10930 [Gammaproteobacteria bacterium]|nr:hypothetical protein [Gammaproteobacteria bacterium]